MRSAKPVVDLIIPGLLNLPIHELDGPQLLEATPNLHKLLRFAKQVETSVSDFDDILIRRLGLKQSGLPYARAIQQSTDGYGLLFKPVHLKADINNAIVFPLEEDSDEITHIIKALSEYFKVDCDIKLLPQGIWMMTLHEVKPVADVPHYLLALGKKVTHYMEQAKSNLAWFKLFNEMQMFLYQHEINQRRQLNGQLLINSLWCWGADEYRQEHLEDTLWFSDDAMLISLGSLYGAHTEALSGLKARAITSDAIVIDLSLLKALKQNPDADLMQLLIEFEQNCLQPLMELTTGELIVHTGAAFNFHYRPRMTWQFWKKPVLLADLQMSAL